MSEFLSRLADLFGASRYLAHSYCLSNDPVILPIFYLSDGSIGIAYYLIAGVLYYCYLNKARVIRLALVLLRDNTFLKIFGFFVLCCGATHHTMLLTLYSGVYYLDAFARFVTAIVSVGAALRIAFVVSKLRNESADLDALSGKTAPPYDGSPPHYP